MKRKSRRGGHAAAAELLFFVVLLVSLEDPTNASSGSRRSSSQSNSTDEDLVGKLPGQDFNVSFAHHAGYVTVNKFSGRAIFYWFFEAAEDPSSKPLVLWLQGGPGCSSIGYGMAVEVGPFRIKPDGKTLYLNTYSWNQEANLLFIDSPVGTGYSYSNNSFDLLWNGDTRAAEDALVFLVKWLKKFPKYKGRDFYIAGENYAGHYIPQLARAIIGTQRWAFEKPINLKGFLVGNPSTDDYYDYLGAFEFKWTNGLIADDTYKQLNFFCKYDSFLKPSPACKKILDIVAKELGEVDISSIYTPACTENSISNNRLRRSHFLERSHDPYDPCYDNSIAVYFNLPEVQKALHVDPDIVKTWLPCNHAVSENWKDTAKSVLPIYLELMFSGLRIWVYSGDTDTVIPVTSTRYWIQSLNLPTVIPWHPWYKDGQVGGWTQVYKDLTYVTFRGAGQLVPLHKPELALTIFKAFLSRIQLSQSPSQRKSTLLK